MLAVNTVRQFRPFRGQPFQHIRKSGGLSFIVGLHLPVVLQGNFPVFPVLILYQFMSVKRSEGTSHRVYMMISANKFLHTYYATVKAHLDSLDHS